MKRPTSSSKPGYRLGAGFLALAIACAPFLYAQNRLKPDEIKTSTIFPFTEEYWRTRPPRRPADRGPVEAVPAPGEAPATPFAGIATASVLGGLGAWDADAVADASSFDLTDIETASVFERPAADAPPPEDPVDDAPATASAEVETAPVADPPAAEAPSADAPLAEAGADEPATASAGIETASVWDESPADAPPSRPPLADAKADNPGSASGDIETASITDQTADDVPSRDALLNAPPNAPSADAVTDEAPTDAADLDAASFLDEPSVDAAKVAETATPSVEVGASELAVASADIETTSVMDRRSANTISSDAAADEPSLPPAEIASASASDEPSEQAPSSGAFPAEAEAEAEVEAEAEAEADVSLATAAEIETASLLTQPGPVTPTPGAAQAQSDADKSPAVPTTIEAASVLSEPPAADAGADAGAEAGADAPPTAVGSPPGLQRPTRVQDAAFAFEDIPLQGAPLVSGRESEPETGAAAPATTDAPTTSLATLRFDDGPTAPALSPPRRDPYFSVSDEEVARIADIYDAFQEAPPIPRRESVEDGDDAQFKASLSRAPTETTIEGDHPNGYFVDPPPTRGETLSLRDVIVYTLKNNPEIGIARWRTEDTKNAIRGARAAIYPTVDLAAAAGVESLRPEGGELTDPLNRRESTLRVTQRVYDFGRSAQVIKRARALNQSQELQQRDQTEAVVLGAVNADLDLLAADRLLQNAKDNVAAHEKIIRLVRLSFEGGNVSESEVKRAQTRLDRARTDMIDFENRREAAINNFRRITGLEPGDLVEPQIALDGAYVLTEQTIDAVLADHPVIQSLLRDGNSLKHQLKAVKRAYLPEFDVEVTGRFQENVLGNEQWNSEARALLR
ncbi:MAG: TolC family protein, partial [Pseudomonadota bacterium]